MKKKEENLFKSAPKKDGEAKKRKKRIARPPLWRLTAAVICCFAVVFAFTFALGRVGFTENKLTGGETYKSIVSLWQIDSFEGGVGSRAEFLLRRSAEFERTRPGVFVMVTPMTAENAAEKLKAGEIPDMISYGYGLNVKNFSPIDTDKKCPYGSLDGEIYAVPWCMGGYAVISRHELQEQKLENAVVSKGAYTQPYAALAESGYTLGNYTEKEPLDAYYRYVSGSADILIGTQRDVNRLFSRDEEAFVTPLGGYNDLYQYFSVTATSSEKKYYAEEFIGYVLSDGVQGKISALGMFSPYVDLTYEAEGLNLLQKGRGGRGISAFLPSAVYEEFSLNALAAATGDGEALKKMKNVLV